MIRRLLRLIFCAVATLAITAIAAPYLCLHTVLWIPFAYVVFGRDPLVEMDLDGPSLRWLSRLVFAAAGERRP
jgi:hypothetical protein